MVKQEYNKMLHWESLRQQRLLLWQRQLLRIGVHVNTFPELL